MVAGHKYFKGTQNVYIAWKNEFLQSFMKLVYMVSIMNNESFSKT